jgi:hypothetical protein
LAFGVLAVAVGIVANIFENMESPSGTSDHGSSGRWTHRWYWGDPDKRPESKRTAR